MAWQAINRITRRRNDRLAELLAEEVDIKAPIDALVGPLPDGSILLDGCVTDIGSKAGFEKALAAAVEEETSTHVWDLRTWQLGLNETPVAEMASILRGTFGFRAPSSANELLGEKYLIDTINEFPETLPVTYEAEEELKKAVQRRSVKGLPVVGPKISASIRAAVKLWLTPTARDLALSRPGNGSGWWTEIPGVSRTFLRPSDAPVIWVKAGCTTRRDRSSTTIQSGISTVSFRVHSNSMDNLMRGFCTRVWRYKGKDPICCTSPPPPQFLRAFKGYPVQPITREEVVERALPRRRTLLEKARLSLMEKPINRRDAAVSTFIKAEKFNFTAKPDADPRLIQPRSDRFLVEHGQYIKAVEPHVFKALGRLNKYPMVAKGFNARDTAAILHKKWSSFKHPVCISLDASRFDQHVSREMLKFTHMVYRRFIKDSHFNRLCEMQLENVGYASCPEGRFKYKVSGRRMSGDMDTSLGNCVIMCGLTYELMGKKAEIFNNGDDCLIICEIDDAPSSEKIKQHYHGYGFNVVEEERVRTFERILFCQTQPVWAEGWVMCRSLTCIAKDLTYIGPKHDVENWLGAISECGLALADGVPVLSAFYRSMARPTSKGIRNSMQYACGMTQLAKGLTFNDFEISDRARLSFYNAFGVSPDEQIAIEKSMAPLDKLKQSTSTTEITLLDYINGKTKKTFGTFKT
uniref:RNA-directed RNA polymerase n=1 Tax=Strawberry associated virus A TaxID=2684439 RepID=A0A7S5GI45_9TOMB|nr:putative replicase [Strawberry associated virus A]